MTGKTHNDLAVLLTTIGATPALRTWFLRLHDLTAAARALALARTVMEMRAGDEDPGLIAAIAALEEPALYEAAYQTVLEHYGS